MVTLQVVLDNDLPVRRDLVVVPAAEDEPARVVPVHDHRGVAEVLGQRGTGAGDVDEHPAVPLLDARRHQPELGTIDPVLGVLSEARRRPAVSAQPVDPVVVRAADGPPRPRGARSEQLVTAVPADVEPAPQRAVAVPDQQHRRAPGAEPPLFAGRPPTSSARPTQTQPPSKKCARSHSKTSCDPYATPGNVRAARSSRVTAASNDPSTGARVIPAVCPDGR